MEKNMKILFSQKRYKNDGVFKIEIKQSKTWEN